MREGASSRVRQSKKIAFLLLFSLTACGCLRHLVLADRATTTFSGHEIRQGDCHTGPADTSVGLTRGNDPFPRPGLLVCALPVSTNLGLIRTNVRLGRGNKKRGTA